MVSITPWFQGSWYLVTNSHKTKPLLVTFLVHACPHTWCGQILWLRITYGVPTQSVDKSDKCVAEEFGEYQPMFEMSL
jgi:hypothetical protein